MNTIDDPLNPSPLRLSAYHAVGRLAADLGVLDDRRITSLLSSLWSGTLHPDLPEVWQPFVKQAQSVFVPPLSTLALPVVPPGAPALIQGRQETIVDGSDCKANQMVCKHPALVKTLDVTRWSELLYLDLTHYSELTELSIDMCQNLRTVILPEHNKLKVIRLAEVGQPTQRCLIHQKELKALRELTINDSHLDGAVDLLDAELSELVIHGSTLRLLNIGKIVKYPKVSLSNNTYL